MSRSIPHDLVAEESLLGAMMLSQDAIRAAVRTVRADDFYKDQHAVLFSAMLVMYGAGHRIDPVTLAAQLASDGDLDHVGGRKKLFELQAQTPASANASHYGQIVSEHGAKRNLIKVAGRIAELGYDAEVDAVEAVEAAKVEAEYLATPALGGLPSPTLDELLAVMPATPDWLVPNLLARGERAVFIAMEGGGKTMLVRQMAVMLAQGIHPFHPRQGIIRPLRVLLIDLENPPDLTLRKFRRIRDKAREVRPDTYDPKNLVLELRPEGIDITNRGDALWLEERVAVNTPEVLCIGPLYKLHHSDESDFRAVRQVQNVLDSVRRRYGVTFLMETHAPHEAFERGKLRISGSRAWMRWPEFVLALIPEVTDKLNGPWIMQHARPPRDDRQWPRVLRRYGTSWPWETVEDLDDDPDQAPLY